jgi:hypothetical protein
MSDPRVAANRDQFHGRVIEQFSFLISGIIVHELAHAVSFSNGQVQILDLPDAARAYGWNNVLPNTAQTALKNADDYRYLALWAGVTDLGYTLPRQSDNDADNVKAAKITAIAQGVLFRYINLTTRSLAMIAKRFWA